MIHCDGTCGSIVEEYQTWGWVGIRGLSPTGYRLNDPVGHRDLHFCEACWLQMNLIRQE